jgi:hypothetical protein
VRRERKIARASGETSSSSSEHQAFRPALYLRWFEDALRERIADYQQQKEENPAGRALIEQIPVEV